MSKNTVLVVGEDADSAAAVAARLNSAEFDVMRAKTQARALALARKLPIEIAVVSDSLPPASNNKALIRSIRELLPDAAIIISSKRRSMRSAVDGIREQAFDYVCLPDDLDRLAQVVRSAVTWRCQNLQKSAAGETGARPAAASLPAAESQPVEQSCATFFVGVSAASVQVRQDIAEASASSAPVLILGEASAGKGLVARLIHQFSRRSETGSFVELRCPAFPEMALEAELFGYERGAFTGPVAHKPGRLDLAQKGVLFFKDVEAISPAMQTRIMEVLQCGAYARIGGAEPIPADVRIMASSTLSLDTLATRVRADLLQHLYSCLIAVPPLRERRKDIPVLCRHFLRVFTQRYDLPKRILPAPVLARLADYAWPGNVHELETILVRFAIRGDLDALDYEIARKPAADKRRSAQ